MDVRVVKIVLKEEEVNHNNPDNKGQRPLLEAFLTLHQGVIRVIKIQWQQ